MSSNDRNPEVRSARELFVRLVHEQPAGSFLLAGCAKDGSGEGPPPKTPPPPPPSSDPGDFRVLVERVIQELTQGLMFARVKPGAGFLGVQRAPIELVRPGRHAMSAERPKRAFLVTYRDRGTVNEKELPDLILEHAMHLRKTSDAGHLEAAASYASGTHGIQILLTETKQQAEEIAQADPLLKKGYYRGFDLQELVRALIGDC